MTQLDEPSLEELLAKGAKVNYGLHTPNNPLYLAISTRHYHTCKLLLSSGAYVTPATLNLAFQMGGEFPTLLQHYAQDHRQFIGLPAVPPVITQAQFRSPVSSMKLPSASNTPVITTKPITGPVHSAPTQSEPLVVPVPVVSVKGSLISDKPEVALTTPISAPLSETREKPSLFETSLVIAPVTAFVAKPLVSDKPGVPLVAAVSPSLPQTQEALPVGEPLHSSVSEVAFAAPLASSQSCHDFSVAVERPTSAVVCEALTQKLLDVIRHTQGSEDTLSNPDIMLESLEEIEYREEDLLNIVQLTKTRENTNHVLPIPGNISPESLIAISLSVAIQGQNLDDFIAIVHSEASKISREEAGKISRELAEKMMQAMYQKFEQMQAQILMLEQRIESMDESTQETLQWTKWLDRSKNQNLKEFHTSLLNHIQNLLFGDKAVASKVANPTAGKLGPIAAGIASSGKLVHIFPVLGPAVDASITAPTAAGVTKLDHKRQVNKATQVVASLGAFDEAMVCFKKVAKILTEMFTEPLLCLLTADQQREQDNIVEQLAKNYDISAAEQLGLYVGELIVDKINNSKIDKTASLDDILVSSVFENPKDFLSSVGAFLKNLITKNVSMQIGEPGSPAVVSLSPADILKMVEKQKSLSKRGERLLQEHDALVTANQQPFPDYDSRLFALIEDIVSHDTENKAKLTFKQRRSNLCNIAVSAKLLTASFRARFNSKVSGFANINIWEDLTYLLTFKDILPSSSLLGQLKDPLKQQDVFMVLAELSSLFQKVVGSDYVQRSASLQQLLVKYPLSFQLHDFVEHHHQLENIHLAINSLRVISTLSAQEISTTRGQIAIMRALVIIGEVSTPKRLSLASKALATSMQPSDWQLLIDLRNRLAHPEWDISTQCLEAYLSSHNMVNLQLELNSISEVFENLGNILNSLPLSRIAPYQLDFSNLKLLSASLSSTEKVLKKAKKDVLGFEKSTLQCIKADIQKLCLFFSAEMESLNDLSDSEINFDVVPLPANISTEILELIQRQQILSFDVKLDEAIRIITGGEGELCLELPRSLFSISSSSPARDVLRLERQLLLDSVKQNLSAFTEAIKLDAAKRNVRKVLENPIDKMAVEFCLGRLLKFFQEIPDAKMQTVCTPVEYNGYKTLRNVLQHGEPLVEACVIPFEQLLTYYLGPVLQLSKKLVPDAFMLSSAALSQTGPGNFAQSLQTAAVSLGRAAESSEPQLPVVMLSGQGQGAAGILPLATLSSTVSQGSTPVPKTKRNSKEVVV